ncbi:Esterase EstB [Caulifigura coniformis]|uniref:Esterase EstB n=1 Tax=Caulifigura coniformis TaxID=2527983 RepID=A0A517S820_9PLAN|nr:serine hydrolase [Caulifigura coniformis]QDT52266.1 Esterase EstB [Caulifigura coniformis]
MRSGLLTGAVLTCLTVTASAGDKWEYLQDRSPAQFQQDFNRLTGDDYRPVTLQFSTFDSAPLYNALFVQDFGPFAWHMRSGIGLEECDRLLASEPKKGFRPITLGACLEGGKPSLGIVFVRDGGRRPWEVKLRLTPAGFRTESAAMAKRGFRPEAVAAYPGQSGVRLAALFVEAAGQAHETKFDLTELDAKAFSDKAWADNRQRVIALTAYPAGKRTRFALVTAADGADGDVVFGLSRAELARELERRRGGTLGVRTVVPYQVDGQMRVAAVFEAPPLELPVTGDSEPELTVFDAALQGYMGEKRLRGATLAVSRNGRLLLSRGYGYVDAEERTAMPPDAMMRLASNAKPLTAMLIQKLARDGKLPLNTRVREFLDIRPPTGRKLDDRWNDVTVEMLLKHRGGWDRKVAIDGHPDGLDPMFEHVLIAKELHRSPPLKPRDFIDFMAGQPLQFQPGEKYAYSNFGYCLLGRVAEQVTGQTYVDALQKEILKPLGATDIELARSRPDDRNPREPVYRDPGESPNALTAAGESVRAADGSYIAEALDSHGGLIASAPHLLKVLDAYWIDGPPRRPGERREYRHLGSLPGNFSVMIQRQDGVNIVCNFNQRTDPAVKGDEGIVKLLNDVADSIRDWPPP